MIRSSKSLEAIQHLLSERDIKSLSFDIDGTLYPLYKVKCRWWLSLLHRPLEARRFYQIKLNWEKRRRGNREVKIVNEDVVFFEGFLTNLLSPDLISQELRAFLEELKSSHVRLLFLSDHGASAKLQRLNLGSFGTPINCLTETGELKPHVLISDLLKEKHLIEPTQHLHVGDRWSDEAQAQLLGCHFLTFKCP